MRPVTGASIGFSSRAGSSPAVAEERWLYMPDRLLAGEDHQAHAVLHQALDGGDALGAIEAMSARARTSVDWTRAVDHS